MEERTIEVTVISASDLKNVKTFGGQQSSYVAAQLLQQRRCTKVDEKGHLHPRWNTKLTFTCDEAILKKGGCFITLEIFSTGLVNDTLIGTVTISVHYGDAFRKGTVATYAVERPSGSSKGTLKLAVKLGKKETITKSTLLAGYSTQNHENESYSPPTSSSWRDPTAPSQDYHGATHIRHNMPQFKFQPSAPSYKQISSPKFYAGGCYEPASEAPHPDSIAISQYPSFRNESVMVYPAVRYLMGKNYTHQYSQRGYSTQHSFKTPFRFPTFSAPHHQYCNEIPPHHK